MNLKKLIGSFNFKKFSKASRTDFGVLKVAFMVAALDGEVTDAEYKALDALGIGYEKTAVGDKYVAENMRRNGHVIGGEQSGHIIFGRLANTGDGLLTAIKVMEAITEQKQPLSVLASGMTMYPQKLKNVIVTDKDETLGCAEVLAAVKKVESDLGENGRVVLRKSGTEPLLRVMVEATSHELCEEKVDEIIAAMSDAGKLIRVK